MADDFLLLQVSERDRGNPQPSGTRLIQSGEQLEDIHEFLDEKCGRKPESITLRADGGQTEANNGSE